MAEENKPQGPQTPTKPSTESNTRTQVPHDSPPVPHASVATSGVGQPLPPGVDPKTRTLSPNEEHRIAALPEPEVDDDQLPNLTAESIEDSFFARFVNEGKDEDTARMLARKRAHEMTLPDDEARARRPGRASRVAEQPVFRAEQRKQDRARQRDRQHPPLNEK